MSLGGEREERGVSHGGEREEEEMSCGGVKEEDRGDDGLPTISSKEQVRVQLIPTNSAI